MTPRPSPTTTRWLEGSERRPAPGARLLGPADPDERLTVTIVVRRRPDGEALPDFDHFLHTPPSERARLSPDEFSAKYGASPDDIKEVTDFAAGHGLTVESTNTARRSVVVSGTVAADVERVRVELGDYEHTIAPRRGEEPTAVRYRGRDGLIHVPESLIPIVVGVFGLDDRRVIKHNAADPPNTTTLSIETITGLYNFPTNSASGQTIAILSEAGYMSSDISTSFGGSPPTVTDVTVDATNDGSADPETTQDIVIAAKAAPGASIAVYFTTYDQKGWVDLIGRIAHPETGDPVCSVVSSSFYVVDGDDAATMSSEGITADWLNATTDAFRDAAIQGVTVCIASGDTGTDSKVADGNAHVQYPGSDPWVLSVGGTTIGNVSGQSFDEYVWNDPDPSDTNHWGTTGGGVSDFFAVPSYQASAGVPASINDSTHHGRGVPDVAANASVNAGYTGYHGERHRLHRQRHERVGAAVGRSGRCRERGPRRQRRFRESGTVRDRVERLQRSDWRRGPDRQQQRWRLGLPGGYRLGRVHWLGQPERHRAAQLFPRAIYSRALYFIVDKSTYGRDEVADVISTAGGLYSDAFWVVLEGFSINQLASLTPTLSGTFHGVPAAIFVDTAGAEYENPNDLYTPQRIRFPYDIIFDMSSLSAFPTATTQPPGPQLDILTASINVAGTTLSADTEFRAGRGREPVLHEHRSAQRERLLAEPGYPCLLGGQRRHAPTWWADDVQQRFVCVHPEPDRVPQLDAGVHDSGSRPAQRRCRVSLATRRATRR